MPEPLYDSSYPGANDSYIIFSVNSGTQVMNGETALRYARSRHSTSDYARSLRQQAIIQALLDKLTKAGTILNPVKAKSIYASVGEFLHTNVSMDEVLRLIPYNGTIKHKSSRQIAVCASYQRETAQAGCLAYTPPMESMGGASVQIPA
ncbi:LCP family protein [Patescibacteria group bacterium]|nr:LCP family protein [Patescibacteria group bacterium]